MAAMDLPAALEAFKDLNPAHLGALGAGFVALVVLILYLLQRGRVADLMAERDRLQGVATRAREILATSPDGIFLWDHVLGGITCSRRLAVLLDLEAGTQARYDDIRARFEGAALERLEHNVSALRGNGTRFDILLESGQRILQAVGARAETEDGVPVADIVWMRDVSAVGGGAAAVPSGDAAATGNSSGLDDRHLTALLDALPFPVWLRDSNLKLAFVNRAGHGSVDPDAAMAERARSSGEPTGERRLVDRKGEAQLLDITEVPLGQPGPPGEATGGTVGYAIDRTEREEAEGELKRRAAARDTVFETLGSAVAIFGTDKRLEFFTRAFAKLWALDVGWLQDRPDYGEVLEKLRETRQLPEVTDFRAFKAENLARFNAVTQPETETLHLPDGRAIRRTLAPYGDGGLAFTYEDLSDQLDLERSVNELSAVQRETLDNLAEGVAVYGSDGRLKLFNPVYARLWELEEDLLGKGPHLSDVLDATRALVPVPEGPDSPKTWPDDDWTKHRDLTVTRLLARAATQGQQKLANGTVVEFASQPLPDGAVLLSYLDVTDSTRVEEALRSQAIAYREADRMKSSFIASVSHELRTPMNTIIGFADMLTQNYFGELNPRQKEYASSILSTSRGLLGVIGDILDLAAIEAGQMELQRETFDVHAMLVSALNLVQERARRKNLKLEFDCPPEIGWMVADERRLKQVVFNLLSNAVTYTPERGNAKLEARRDGGDIVVSVSDTGVGIPTEERERIFQAFEKGQAAHADDAEEAGVGLGLTIVKKYVEMHGGEVTIKSQSGRGTTIACRIPAGQVGEGGGEDDDEDGDDA